MKQIIFDLGFHNGEDTENYLSKGFKVIAVEANKALYLNGLMNFKEYIYNGDLILLHKAIYDTDHCEIDFYINPVVTEWGSIKKEIAEQDNNKSKKEKVDTITFSELCKKYGTPYYCKVDIESADIFVAQELYKYSPKYISFELNKIDYAKIFSYLNVNDYISFQLINQAHHNNSSSGEFGEFLDKEKWLTFDEALNRYLKFKELRLIDNKNLSFGWLDIHAGK